METVKLDARCGHLLTGPPAADGSTSSSGSDLSWVVAKGLEGGELVQSHQVATVTVGVAEHERSGRVEASSIIRARRLSSVSEVASLDGSNDLGSSPEVQNMRGRESSLQGQDLLVVSCSRVALSSEACDGSTLIGHHVTAISVVDEVAP